MSKPFDTWTVLPHGELVELDEDLWTVTGELHMPLGEFPRRMTVARLESGGLVVFSAIALSETEMTKLLALGQPEVLIVPSDRHRLDVKPWKNRFPGIRVIAPVGAREKVEELVPVDENVTIDDPRVRFVTMAGTNDREGALRIERPSGVTIVLNELVFNVPNRPGVGGWLFKMMGMTGEQPHVPGVIKMREVKDAAALGDQLTAWSRENVVRIVVSHGSVIESDAPSILARVAHDLAA